MTVTEFDFTPTTIPARQVGPGRPASANPFLDQVAQLVDEDGNPRDLAMSFVLADAPDSVAAERIKRQLARAGIVHHVSVFKRIEPTEDGNSLVTFWAQTQIIPQRKPKETAPESNGAASTDEGAEGASASAQGGSVTVLEP